MLVSLCQKWRDVCRIKSDRIGVKGLAEYEESRIVVVVDCVDPFYSIPVSKLFHLLLVMVSSPLYCTARG
jgi:hypothetical protein